MRHVAQAERNSKSDLSVLWSEMRKNLYATEQVHKRNLNIHHMHDYLYDPITKTLCGHLWLGAHTCLLSRCQAPYQPAMALALHSSLSGHVRNRAERMQSAACLT